MASGNTAQEWVLWEHTQHQPTIELCSIRSTGTPFQYQSIPQAPVISKVFATQDKEKPKGFRTKEYSLFRSGIRPDWDDPKHHGGGRLFCKQDTEETILDHCWERLVVGAIDGALVGANYSHYIDGVRVADKSRAYPCYQMEVWLNTADDAIVEVIRDITVHFVNAGMPADSRHKNELNWKWVPNKQTNKLTSLAFFLYRGSHFVSPSSVRSTHARALRSNPPHLETRSFI